MDSLQSELLDKIASVKITCSFVVGEDGQVVDDQGGSKGLGNQTDLELLKALRANAEVVLTSGLTARVEEYRMPRHADLAIFTRRGVAGLNLKPKAGQKLQILTPPLVNSYREAIDAVRSKYATIHVEFGPAGARAIKDQIEVFVISSVHESGLSKFLAELELTETDRFFTPDLFITLAVGRG